MIALALALLAAAAPAGRPAGPALLRGGRSVPLDLSVEVLPLRAGEAAPPPLAWHSEDGALVAAGGDSSRRVSLRLTPGDDASVSLEASIRYLEPVEVEREAVRLRLAGPAAAVGRDLSFERVDRPLRVDRGTPVVVSGAEVMLAGGPGIVAARYAPGGTRERPEVAVDLVLDDAGAHPFAVYPRCLDEVPGLSDGSSPVSFSDLERKRSLARTTRRAGDTVAGRVTLYPLLPGRAALPLVVERWPAGARGAVVITDHADRTDPVALRALLHGDSRLVCRPGGPLGLLGHGLRMTKSFFLHARRGGLDEPETRQLALELLAAGSEVASHSPTGSADDREAVRAALPALAAFGVVTWIDHQPYTNCEAFSSEGWRSGGRYGIRDLLAAAGFRWIWEAGDRGGFGREPRVENLFTVDEPGAADPPIYPLPVDPGLWVFQSTMFQGTPRALAAALSDQALDRLERERGLFVAHTYLSASPRTTSRPELVSRLVVRQLPDGALELDPLFDQALGRIAARVRAGTLASLTLAEAAERLRDLGEVEVRYLDDGAAEVDNHGALPIAGLTVAVPAGGMRLAVEGAKVAGSAGEPDRTRVWFDLPAGGRVVVRAGQGALPTALVAAVRAVLGPQ